MKLSDEAIEKYIKRAKYVAIKRGYSELADDFSQEIFIEFIQNPARGATLDQLFIDYLRRTHGRPGTPGGDARIYAERNSVSLDAYATGGEYQEIQLPSHNDRGSLDDDTRFKQSPWGLTFLFRGKQAEIYRLYFLEEMKELEIAHLFGLAESRISQLLQLIKKEIENYYILKEMKERMEWDEKVGIFQIDWIQI